MLFLIDSANLEGIAKIYRYYPIAGVTTNPNILNKYHINIKEAITQIQQIIGKEKMLHVQVIATECDQMIAEAEKLKALAGDHCYVKIPVTQEGIRAMQILHKQGFKITATAIFTPLQALMAARAGADFVAPYINRMDNISSDGARVAAEISDLFHIHHIETKILAASFNNVEQIYKAGEAGAHAVTVGTDLFEKIIYHPLTDIAVNDFLQKGMPYYKY